MNDPEFLEADVVLFLHDRALREYGGIQAIKHEDLLQSALDRPIDRHAHADPQLVDLFELAAAYAYGLAGNHPFHDGNKRTAWSSCVPFLKVNRIELDAAAADIVDRMVRLVTGKLDETGFAAWRREVRKVLGSVDRWDSSIRPTATSA